MEEAFRASFGYNTAVSEETMRRVEREINVDLIRIPTSTQFSPQHLRLQEAQSKEKQFTQFIQKQQHFIETKKLHNEIREAELEKHTMSLCSFSPQVHAYETTEPVEKRLYDNMVYEKRKILKEEFDKMQTAKAMSQCTFRPAINKPVKQKVVQHKIKSDDGHKNSFHPKTNKLKDEYMSNPYFWSPSHVRLSSENRAGNVLALLKNYSNCEIECKKPNNDKFIKRQNQFLQKKEDKITQQKKDNVFPFSPRIEPKSNLILQSCEDTEYKAKECVDEEEKECTFSPKIIKKKGGYIVKRNKQAIPVIKEDMSECRFKPMINEYKNVGSKLRTSDPNFMSDLIDEQCMKQYVLDNKKLLIQSMTERECTHKPVVHKAPDSTAQRIINADHAGYKSYLELYNRANNI
jgi:hypothetical protein